MNYNKDWIWKRCCLAWYYASRYCRARKIFDDNYVEIKGEQYYRVPSDYYFDNKVGNKYVEMCKYDVNSNIILSLNPAYAGHKCETSCPSTHKPTDEQIERVRELNTNLDKYSSYYIIAEFAYTHTELYMQIDDIVSPWRIALGRPKRIVIDHNGREEQIEIIEIIEDYVE